MAFYTDPKTLASQLLTVTINGTLGTSTASGANAITSAVSMPKFPKRVALRKVRAIVRTAPAANHTGVALAILNGTSTVAVLTIGTNTAGAAVDAQVSGVTGASGSELFNVLGTGTEVTGRTFLKRLALNTLAIFAADAGPTVTLVSTATASGMSAGAVDLTFEIEPQHE